MLIQMTFPTGMTVRQAVELMLATARLGGADCLVRACLGTNPVTVSRDNDVLTVLDRLSTLGVTKLDGSTKLLGPPEPPARPKPRLRPDGVARRCDLLLQSPAEKAIGAAVQAVEEAGAHPWLTEAVNLLGDAKNRVADFVELTLPWPNAGAPAEQKAPLYFSPAITKDGAGVFHAEAGGAYGEGSNASMALGELVLDLARKHPGQAISLGPQLPGL